jgi:hypothetical protein
MKTKAPELEIPTEELLKNDLLGRKESAVSDNETEGQA